MPSSASVNAPKKVSFAVVALKLGGEVQPAATPVAGAEAATPAS